MSDLIQSVKDGIIQQTKGTTEQKAPGNALGKDAFLQLLVTQMKYQDPLNPNTDTEFIAQLATFSQLEQMQNLNSVTTNSQALNLVGKQVIVKAESKAGTTNLISGKVDFVNMSGGKARLSIGGSFYSIDQLDSIIDDYYMLEQGLPRIPEKINLDYDLADPKDLSFEVYLGEGETIADNIAILVQGTVIDSEKVSIKGNMVTIDQSAFEDYPIGTHKIIVAFNDPLYTTVSDKVTLNVTSSGDPSGDNPDFI